MILRGVAALFPRDPPGADLSSACEGRDHRRRMTGLPAMLVTSRPWAAKESAADLGVPKVVRRPFDPDEMSTVAARVVAKPAEDGTEAPANRRRRQARPGHHRTAPRTA